MDQNIKNEIVLDAIKTYLFKREESLEQMKADCESAGDKESRSYLGITWALDEVKCAVALIRSMEK